MWLFSTSPVALADYLLELDRDEEAYRQYLNWRQRPFRPAFRELCEQACPRPFEVLARIMIERK
jgi:TorA maturation chaperone TorD